MLDKLLKLFFFIFLFTLPSLALDLDSLIKVGVLDIYSIKFKKADKIFNKVQEVNPNGPESPFFKAMILWWKVQLDYKDEKYDKQFLDAVEKSIKVCDEILKKDPKNGDALFYKGGALGFRGRLYTFRSKWLKAALSGKKALPLLNKAKKYAPDNIDLSLGYGIYDYYAKAIPEKYSFVKPFMVFFPKGNKKRGIKELLKVERSGKYAVNEAIFQLMTIYYMFENNVKKSLEYAEKLHEKFPDNPIFQRYLGRSFIKAGRLGNAYMVYENIMHKHFAKFEGYNMSAYEESNYYIGYIYFKFKKFSKAEKYFNKVFQLDKEFDRKYKSGYYVYATLYLGNIFDVRGMRYKAKKMYENVLDYKKYGNSKKWAKKFIRNKFKP